MRRRGPHGLILLCSIGTFAVTAYCFLHINGNKNDAEASR